MGDSWDEIIEPAPGSFAALVGLRMTRRAFYEETTGRLVPRESDSEQG